jgi:hypothetical protein
MKEKTVLLRGYVSFTVQISYGGQWVDGPALLLDNYVTLGKHLNFLSFRFLLMK